MCIDFGMGAAIGAGMTEVTRAHRLVIPVALTVFLLREQKLMTARR